MTNNHSNKSEKQIENEIKKWLKVNGYYHFKNHGNVWTEAGRPDIVACVDGKFVAIEVKKHGGVESKAQHIVAKQIIKSGGIHMFAYSLDDVLEVLGDNHE